MSTPAPSSENPVPGYVPVRFKTPAKTPVVVYTMIATCVAVFIFQQISVYLLGGDIPAALGAKVNSLIRAGQVWRLVTPLWLHGSIVHIAFNMYALYSIGRSLEQQYGHLRFAALYFLSGIAGNLFSFYLTSNNSVGASTALFGIIAAEAVFLFKNQRYFRNAQKMLTNMVSMIVLNLLIGLSPGIDNWGHLGGLIGGVAFGWFAGPILDLIPSMDAGFGLDLKDTRRSSEVWITAAGIFVVLVALAAVRIIA